MAGVDMVHVPYKGTGALLPDLLSGRVPMMFENVAIMTAHIKKGSLRPLAISSAKRTALLPERADGRGDGQGLEGSRCSAGSRCSRPAKTPPAVISFSTPS